MKRFAFFSLLLVVLFAFCNQHNKKESPKAETKQTVKSPAIPIDTYFNDLASYVAGIAKAGSKFDTFQNLPYWVKYSKVIDSNWQKIDSTRLKKMVKWAAVDLKTPKANAKIIFYPFAGPDFMNVFTFFPEADTFYMLALEFCGNLPDVQKMKTKDINNYFDNVKISLSDIFDKSYFITYKMGSQLQKVEGVLPIICFFMKRTGNDIVSISNVTINAYGKLVETPYKLHYKSTGQPYGIKIRFINPNYPTVKTVYYFSGDLSDAVFNPASKFYKYLNSITPNYVTYVKSASYLLAYPFFSNIRNIVLAKTKYLLQDDTGIPYKYIDPKIWNIKLYGKYVNPIADFKGMQMQPELKKAYADSTKIYPLPFNIGYHWRDKKDNLLYAEKK